MYGTLPYIYLNARFWEDLSLILVLALTNIVEYKQV